MWFSTASGEKNERFQVLYAPYAQLSVKLCQMGGLPCQGIPLLKGVNPRCSSVLAHPHRKGFLKLALAYSGRAV